MSSYRYARQLSIAAASSMPTQLHFLYPLTNAPPPPSHSLSQLSTLAHMCLWRLCQVFTSFVSINNKITHSTLTCACPPSYSPASNPPSPCASTPSMSHTLLQHCRNAFINFYFNFIYFVAERRGARGSTLTRFY